MRTLTPIELLEVWESGLDRKPAERAVAMLRAVRGAASDEDPARLPIGGLDSRLLTLREQAFGPEIRGVTSCRNCGESIEVQFLVDGVRLPAREVRPRLTLDVRDYSLEFRLPDSLDLLTLQDQPADPAVLRRKLLERCLSRITYLGEPVAAVDLPEWVTDEVARAMATADPQAEIELGFECSSCHRQSSERFDIESFFWHEIQAWATRMLYEVHQLAAAYGWNEAEVLALSAVRRSAYLNLITEY